MTSEPLFRVSETANSSSHTRNCAENSDCSPTIRNIQLVKDCVVGPGVVPRHGDFNNLDCQTGLTGVTGAKGIFRCCQISRAMICPIGSGTNAARSNLLTESN
jgi:hypothetical protein